MPMQKDGRSAKQAAKLLRNFCDKAVDGGEISEKRVTCSSLAGNNKITIKFTAAPACVERCMVNDLNKVLSSSVQ